MKHRWNVDPTKAITIARLIGFLESASYILDCYDEPEELEYIENMKRKYYKLYFQKIKEEQN